MEESGKESESYRDEEQDDLDSSSDCFTSDEPNDLSLTGDARLTGTTPKMSEPRGRASLALPQPVPKAQKRSSLQNQEAPKEPKLSLKHNNLPKKQ